jgi:hypothetical protein
VANAFITPLLLAALADVVDHRRLGRSVGTFAARADGGDRDGSPSARR